MPVQIVERDEDKVGRFQRLSASQANTYRACARLWFYEKVYRFKMPQIPVLFVGRAVEEAVCRVLRESPSIISPHAVPEALPPSPFGDDGRYDSSVPASTWPAAALLPFFEDERPQSLEDLRKWALQRCAIHLPPALERMRLEWETDERKAGDWSEVDEDVCLSMTERALEFHLGEVERCFDAGGGPWFESWRTGHRPEWPAPDGYALLSFPTGKHPLACSGNITWAEAWEVARPWFVDPDAPSFSMNAVHPDHWFQGEYDLVYRWEAASKVVDLKASVGASDRSGDYVEQLKIYAMLWYITHGRKDQLGGLEIWYLGHPSIKSVDVPSVAEHLEREQELFQLWQFLKQGTPSIHEYPAEPSPLRGFGPGGVSIESPEGSRCDRCDWSAVCPGSEGDEPPSASPIQLPGASARTALASIGSLDPRGTFCGELVYVGSASQQRSNRLSFKQGQHMAQVQIATDEHHDGGSTVPFPLERGMSAVVENAVFTVNWKGEIVLKIDPFARVLPNDGGEEGLDLLDMQAKHNLTGLLVYKFEKSGVGRNGQRWSRRGMMIMDNTGATKVEGWFDDWGPQYDIAEVGDTVVVANVGLDAWAVETRADYTRQSSLHVVRRGSSSAA